MKKKEKIVEKIEGSPDYCPIRNILDRFGDKWSLLVMYKLSNHYSIKREYKLRFNELHRAIGGISQKMLTVTLRALEADGLVSRKIFPEIPPRVEYSLTDLGKSLIPIISNLSDWANENQAEIFQARQNYQRLTSKAS